MTAVKTTKFAFSWSETGEIAGKTARYMRYLQNKFVTWRNNGISSPINEFASP
jgi:hypothetical protein